MDVQKKVRRLERAISARYDSDTMNFRSANLATAQIEGRIAQLRAMLLDLGATTTGSPLNASIAIKHRSWIETQIKALNIELASAYVKREEARNLLATSSAKSEIVKRLRK